MVVTIDGVGLTTGFIGSHYSYTQLQCTHYSRPSHKATLHSLQRQRLLNLYSSELSRLSLSRAQDLLQTRLFFSHWPSTNSLHQLTRTLHQLTHNGSWPSLYSLGSGPKENTHCSVSPLLRGQPLPSNVHSSGLQRARHNMK
jgi:hypothetical protein